jgi:hypothetical protein
MTADRLAAWNLYLRLDAFHGEWNYSLLPRLILPQE